MEIDTLLSIIKIKPNCLVLDLHVPASMVSTCQIGNTLAQCVSAKYFKDMSILVNKTGLSTCHLQRCKQNGSSLVLRPNILSEFTSETWLNSFPWTSKTAWLHQNCLNCGIPQRASEHWESLSWGGKNPFQGSTLNSTCQWVSDLACALDEFYLPIY